MSRAVAKVFILASLAHQHAALVNAFETPPGLIDAVDGFVPYQHGIVLDVQLWLCAEDLGDELPERHLGDLPHVQHLRDRGWEAVGPVSIETQGDAVTTDLQMQCSFLDDIFEIDLVSVWVGSTCRTTPQTHAILLGILTGVLRIPRREVQGIIILVHDDILTQALPVAPIGLKAVEVFVSSADTKKLSLGMSAGMYVPECTPLRCELGSTRAALLQLVRKLDSTAWHPEVEDDSSPVDLTQDVTTWLHEVTPGESVSTGTLGMLLGASRSQIQDLGDALSKEECWRRANQFHLHGSDFFWFATQSQYYFKCKLRRDPRSSASVTSGACPFASSGLL
eukprot:4364311-Amphidinium_carterae.1